ncbi:DUF397 domain-containing protein [Streptomyces sp. B1866]|uniref:DUF397 domain-containing protein n=1 Tax=Streptomyces sp. B1866 TaxID=3075431 RepID=UPI002890EE02|nr:DUF397 domain-containing protein [Streptomyces sp. B1866]MDT3395553.1 DUF397 domain-containing protein [Streptomyces sp. B1866]
MSDLNWRKSSYSPEAANCVYVAAPGAGTVKLRESDEPGVILTTTPAALRTFIHAAKAGEFDCVTEHGLSRR